MVGVFFPPVAAAWEEGVEGSGRGGGEVFVIDD